MAYNYVATVHKPTPVTSCITGSAGQEEVERGQSTIKQLALWDCLLENRIRLQTSLLIVNQLPQPDTMPAFELAGGSFQGTLQKGRAAVKDLLEHLLKLQEDLSVGKKRPLGEEEEEEEKEAQPAKKLKLEQYPEFLKKQHSDFIPFRDATIQKWDDKTRVSTGKLKKGFSAFDKPTLKQIEQILADKDRLIKRTQIKRGTYRVLGKPEKVEEEAEQDEENQEMTSRTQPQKEQDEEIFDDDDFYHQMLRELIKCKTADIHDPIALSRHLLEIQKLRSKSKNKVDRRASKDRKVRYHVHKKMVNFMAADRSCITYDDEAMDELCRSLPGHKEEATET